ncbi:MAG: DUF3251 domain-containing protein [Thermodesulfobacteriota bacterium]
MRVLVAFSILIFLSGCNLIGTSKIQEEQQAHIEELEKKVKELETSVLLLELTKNTYDIASFDPAADEGFQRIDTSVGTFAVSVEEVKPQADGVKVRLNVGNLTSATVSGGTFTIKWGPRRGDSDYPEWQRNLSEKEQKFTDDLRPGTWNPVTLTLPGLPPDKFGYLQLGMKTSQIKLILRK